MSKKEILKNGKKSIPLWRNFDKGRIYIWLSWAIIYFSFFELQDYKSYFKEHIFLLIKISLIALVLMLPIILAGVIGVKKVLWHLTKMLFYPLAIPFLVFSFLLETFKLISTFFSNPISTIAHYLIVLSSVAYGVSLSDKVAWGLLQPFLGILIVSNIIWTTLWICNPFKSLYFLTGALEKNKISIKGFFQTYAKSGNDKLSESVKKICNKVDNPLFITISFVGVLAPVIIINVVLFALMIKGETVLAAGDILPVSGTFFSSNLISYLEISLASFINFNLNGVVINSHELQSILLLEGVSGLYFLVGIFFAFSSFGLERAKDVTKSLNLLIDDILFAIEKKTESVATPPTSSEVKKPDVEIVGDEVVLNQVPNVH